MKSWILHPLFLGSTPSKWANSCFVSRSTILILFSHCEHQASSFGCEEMLSISKKGSCQWLWQQYITPMIVNDFFRESPGVSPCNCFDFSSTRLNESSFWLLVGSIFLITLLSYCLLNFLFWDFEVWWWINFIP